MKPNYNKVHWHNNSNLFKKWCNGETGYPVVDAGMRQLNKTLKEPYSSLERLKVKDQWRKKNVVHELTTKAFIFL